MVCYTYYYDYIRKIGATADSV